MEFPELKKRYRGLHFWTIGFGFWSTGNITDETIMTKVIDTQINNYERSILVLSVSTSLNITRSRSMTDKKQIV